MDKNNTDLYAQKLKTLRINQFISQRFVANKMKIGQQAYSKLENGKTRFNIKKVEKISKIFRIEAEDFLTINITDSKVKNRKMDSFNVRVLKNYYEIKLQEQKVKIGLMDEEIRKLKRIKAKYENKY